MKYYVVDRIENGTAVLTADCGASFEAPFSSLPAGTKEGDVLFRRRFRWQCDPAERQRREERAAALFEKLTKNH